MIGLSGTGVAADTAAGRIMELSKKNRELTADLESERNKLRQLTKKMREMEREVQLYTMQLHSVHVTERLIICNVADYGKI